METGGKCVLGGQAYPGQGVWSVPDAGVGAPTPRSVPRLCQISGADEKQFKGWFGHWKAHCPQRKRNRLDGQVNGQVKTGKSKPGAVMSEFCVSKTVAPSRKRRHHAITPKTRAGRRVRRPGGFVPPPVISDGSSLSDSDDDTLATEATIQQAGAPTAGSDDDPSNSEDVGDAGQSDIADVGDVSQHAVGNLSEGVQQMVPALAADDATGVLMESDASDGETAQPPGGEQTVPVEASGSEDEQDDAPAPRRSTRSCQPPVRYGFHVNSIDTDRKPKTLSDMHPLKRTCNNAKSCIQRSTRGSGIEGRCPEVVRQVPRPSTPGQREIGKGTWASDMFVGSVLGSTLQFLLA
ncbi:hypothetical protein Bbelb_399390 [Branchiostoma belcheri]|nr:hypothetical protein Bbelb_399390 [Branchiostoma belcheri]